MSSLVALKIMATLLLLQMHACNARHNFDLVSYTNKWQDADADKTKLLHESNIKDIPVFKDTNETSSDDVSIETLDKNTRPMTEMQNFKGKPRSVLESETHDDIKEKTNANEGETVEDAVVMDYVQPHRKSPIHNHH